MLQDFQSASGHFGKLCIEGYLTFATSSLHGEITYFRDEFFKDFMQKKFPVKDKFLMPYYSILFECPNQMMMVMMIMMVIVVITTTIITTKATVKRCL